MNSAIRKAAAALGLLLSAGTTLAQQVKNDTLPFQKYPSLPAFNILLLDSSTVFNTYNVPQGKPTVLMFFSPDCDHCEMQTDSILKHMDAMKNVNFYLFTPLSLAQTRVFYNKLGLKKYPNITVGQDSQFFFPAFYGTSYVPYIVVYDRNKKLVKGWEGGVKIPELLSALGIKE